MKVTTNFWKIIFLLVTFSSPGLSTGSENEARLIELSFKRFVISFYPSKQQSEDVPLWFTIAIRAKVYHKVAVSFPMSEVKRIMAKRLPGHGNGTTKAWFLGTISILTETIFNFIYHALKLVDLKNEWFHQFQF